MSLTYRQARDEIFAEVKTAWDPTGHEMIWPDVPKEKPTDSEAPYARTRLRHATGEQATLANHNGVRRWRRDGSIIIQVFTPLGGGLSVGYDLAKMVSDAFEGKTTAGGVQFLNTRINEIGPSGNWYQINVTADFNYDEIK